MDMEQKMAVRLPSEIRIEERPVEKGTNYEIGMDDLFDRAGFVSISLYTGSKIAFVIGFGLQLIGFIIQTITKKKKDEKVYEN